jgi:coenzyme F420-0:L-glutamate ligase/coenzyme F420-1:gamma-L-glutamate ligase
MQATVVAVTDQLASAADLAGGKVGQRPVVLMRGFVSPAAGTAFGTGAAALVMPRAQDLFP